MSNQAKKERISSSGTLFAYSILDHQRKRKKKRTKSVTSCTNQERNDGDNTQNPEDQMNNKGFYFSALVFREEINHTKDLLS